MRPLSQFRQGVRLLAITHILATHGLAALAVRMRLFRPYAWLVRLFSRGEPPPNELGAQVRDVLERLGPTFIKFGQMLSTRVDLLPMEVALELKKLQDEVPAESFDRVREVLERTFKRPLLGKEGSFASFNVEPVAAASIAQVHFAELHDGRLVAVKVRRPWIKKTIEADLALLRQLARLFNRYFPEYRRLKAIRVVEEFSTTIREELNLRAEAAHAARFEQNLASVEGVGVPRVIWEYTNVEVLTTERIEGIPIDERERLKAAGHDTLKLCERATTLFFHMVFVDGYFHADLHPGNIFVSREGHIQLVDFGIVGRLDIQSRRYLAEMLLAFLKKDYRRAAEVHREADYIGEHVNLSAFEDALREIAEPIFNRPLAEISLAELLLCLFSVTERFQMEVQPELLLLQKTMVVLEGVGRELEPSINIWELSRPLVAGWMREYMGPRARVEQGLQELRDALIDLRKLPGQVREVVAKVEAGQEVQARISNGSWLRSATGSMMLAGGGIGLGFHAYQQQAGFTYLALSVLAMVLGVVFLARR